MVDVAFDMVRMSAIKKYSELENILATLISNALKVKIETGWSIFYRVSNTRARYAIVGDAFRTNFPSYRKTWELIERWLRAQDTKRNHIVHWFPVNNGGQRPTTLTNPATFMAKRESQLEYAIDDLNRAAHEANMLLDVIVNFLDILNPSAPNEPLRDIFLQLTADQSLEEFHKALTSIEGSFPPQS